MVLLIVNADDMGICEQRTLGIVQLYKEGKVTSVSLMVNMEYSQKAGHLVREEKMKAGLHLNLTEGTPLHLPSSLAPQGVFLGKQLLRDHINLVSPQDINKEIQLQIEQFIQLTGKTPTHLDGHQHIQVIKEVAQELAPLMATYGIYRLRQVSTQLAQHMLTPFHQQVQQMQSISQPIYQQHHIISPLLFLGINQMGQYLTTSNILHQLNHTLPIHKTDVIELMCHPGNLSQSFDQFNQSPDRLKEKEYLQQELDNLILAIEQLYKDKVILSDYQSVRVSNESSCNILLYGKLSLGTGNHITMVRYKDLVEEMEIKRNVFYGQSQGVKGLKVNVYMRKICLENEEEAIELDALIEEFQIEMIIGINLYRVGQVVSLLSSPVPLITVAGGTDVNEFIHQVDKLPLIQQMVQKSHKVICLSNDMQDTLISLLGLGHSHKYIVQTQCVSHQPLLNHPLSISIDIRYILGVPQHTQLVLLTGGARPVKDQIYVLDAIGLLLSEHPSHVFLRIGPILDKHYYQSYLEMVTKVEKKYGLGEKRMFSMDHLGNQDYLSVLRQSQLLINSSISEGTCGSILEAMLYKVPVLARDNKGNTEIICSSKNGYVFDSPEQFSYLYRLIFSEENQLSTILEQAYKDVEEKHNTREEQNMLISLIQETHHLYYQTILLATTPIQLLNHKGLHQISSLNIDLFQTTHSHYASLPNQSIQSILDVGSGCGIFAITQAIALRPKQIHHIVLSDYVPLANQVALFNFNLNRNQLTNVHKVTTIQSDIISNPSLAHFKFDIILVNLPQTPSNHNTLIDRVGHSDGSFYNSQFAEQILNISHESTLTFQINISTSNPKKLQTIYQNQNLDFKIFKQQIRTVSKQDLDIIHPTVYDLILDLQSQGIAECKEITEGLIEYSVRLLKISKLQQ